MIAQARKPFDPIPDPASRRHMHPLALSNPVKRDRMTTIMVSADAFDVIYRETQERGGTFGGIGGLIIDYLARNGKLSAVLDDALSERHT